MFQDFNLLAGLTALENVTLPLELDGIAPKRARPAGLEALERLGVRDKADRFPDDLSGGERQRVAIARAIVGDRHILLADEPTGALDSVNGEAVMRLLRAACRDGVTGVVVTHDAQLASWADRIVFLRDGRLVDQTAPPAGPETLLVPGAPMSTGGRVARRALRRWSWRLYRREWRQQVLVLALITVAVAASVFGATAAYNLTDTRVAEFGSANHRFENAVARPEDIAPYTAEAEEWFGTIEVIGHQQVPIPGTTAAVELRSIEPDGAFSGPMVSVLEGRRPASVDEIALTEGAAADLDAGLGDQIDVGRNRYEVVGIVENPADLDDEYALVLPAGQTPESITLLVDADREHADRFRPSVTPGQGFIESREVTEQTTAAVAVFVVATVAMVLVCLVAGASFATLAHRRMRQLGLLAAAGATPRHLRRAMVANGTAVGLTAAVAGTGAGLLAWLASASALEPAAAHRIDPWNIPPWLPVAGIGLAVATATVAAWWPARAVARMPITDAVAARPPAPRRVHRSLIAAVALLRLRRPRDRRGHRPQLRSDDADLLHLRHRRPARRRAPRQRTRAAGGGAARRPLPGRHPPGRARPGPVRIALGGRPRRDHPRPRHRGLRRRRRRRQRARRRRGQPAGRPAGRLDLLAERVRRAAGARAQRRRT